MTDLFNQPAKVIDASTDDAEAVRVRPMRPDEAPAVRRVLNRIGWDKQYVEAMAANAPLFAGASETRAAFVAETDGAVVGFVYAELHAWNRLVQIQGLAVDPDQQRRGVATFLVANAEEFARMAGARGIFVDTPTENVRGRAFYCAIGYREAYVMPRYYEDELDGVTYQKFFSPPAPDRVDVAA